MCMHNFKSHFWWDFLAYCTRPASVHLVIAFIGCSFDRFSIFLLNLKQQQNLMKIMFSCIHFPVWPYPPILWEKKNAFYTGKLYGLTGMKCTHLYDEIQVTIEHKHFWQKVFVRCKTDR